MIIFRINKNNLDPIKEKNVGLEKEIQKLTETNLEKIFGLQFVSSEFYLHGLRIDTLAFDPESKSFVIIEYKKDKSFSIIDQGFAYLALMLNNKADFVLEYNEKTKQNLKKQDIDWTQSKIIFLANSFTAYQRNAINFKDLPIELWEVKVFDDNTIFFNQLISPEAKESIKTISKATKEVERVSREIKVYTIDDHLVNKSDGIKELFFALQERILNLDERIIEKPVKFYIGYKIGNRNFVALHIHKSRIEVHLVGPYKEDLDDPKNKVQNIPESYGWGKISRFFINNLDDIDYATSLIRQSYEKIQ